MTIIEILIVIALLGTIMTIVMTNILDKSDDAKKDLTLVQLRKIAESIGLYKVHTGRVPSTEDGLQALVQAPANAKHWKGPYTDGEKLRDPWGNDLSYLSSSPTRYQIRSAGPDQELESSDDIRFPEETGVEGPRTIELQVPEGNLAPGGAN